MFAGGLDSPDAGIIVLTPWRLRWGRAADLAHGTPQSVWVAGDAVGHVRCHRPGPVAAAFRPGQRTAVHDHIAWCVVGCIGEEHETRYRLVGDHLIEDGAQHRSARLGHGPDSAR